MTHVVHPYAHRLGIIRDWKSRWFAGKDDYAEHLKADILIRRFLDKKLKGNYVATVDLERTAKLYRIAIHTSRPGMIIGREGSGIMNIKATLDKFIKKNKLNLPEVKIDIIEVTSPEADAAVVAAMIVEGIEKRLPFRRVLKSTIEKVMANRDVKGARIAIAGRLGGAEMARKEEIKRGGIPLQTLRADISFAKESANMTYGVIGVKVWIYRGMKFDGKKDTK